MPIIVVKMPKIVPKKAKNAIQNIDPISAPATSGKTQTTGDGKVG
jgi:hypothetical protein